MTKTICSYIADWTCGDAVAALPAEGLLLCKRAFLDTIGVTLLGSRQEATKAVAAVEILRPSHRDASVIGMRRKTDPLSAALINGTAAHADLFDDNNAPMIAHPSSPLVSSLLPLAQSRDLPGRAVIEAYSTGFEVGVRLGRAFNPGIYERGWHVTRTLGVLGATAACCRLIGLDSNQTSAALGIAVSMASGVRQNFGTMAMALHVGLTARDAVHCALLAEAGMRADPAAMEGKYGFAKTFYGGPMPDFELGPPFELVTSGIIFKPYPSGAPTHAAVDAALAIRRSLSGAAGSIVEVRCKVHAWNAMTLREDEPRDGLQAKVNLRYCIAVALIHGQLSPEHFTDSALADPPVKELMQKISIQAAEDLPDNGEFPAELLVRTMDGETLTERREVPPGGSSRPLDQSDIEAKFRACSQSILHASVADRVINQVARLESLPSVRGLCESLEGDFDH